MPNNMNTTSDITQALSAFYSRSLLERALPFLPHALFGQTRDLPTNSGTVMKFRRYGALAINTTALTEGVTPQGKKLSYTDILATIEQYGDYVEISDKLLMTTFDPILTETAQILGEQAGQSIDAIVRDVILAGTNVQYADAAANRAALTASNKLDAAEVRLAVRTLKRNKASRITRMVMPDVGFNTSPIKPSFIGLIHVDTTYDIEQDSAFVSIEKYANKAEVLPGEVGKIGDVRFIESTEAKVYEGAGSGGVDVYGTLIMGRYYYGISRIRGHALENIVKGLGSAGTADPLNQRATSGWKATLAAVRLNEDYAVRIEHGATA